MTLQSAHRMQYALEVMIKKPSRLFAAAQRICIAEPTWPLECMLRSNDGPCFHVAAL